MLTEQDKEDCAILLKRSLLNTTLAGFGRDGFGQFGQCDAAQHYPVKEITVLMHPRSNGGIALIELQGYHSGDHGHLMTDRNIEISINKLLKDNSIDPGCWAWADEKFQGEDFIVIHFDADFLLN